MKSCILLLFIFVLISCGPSPDNQSATEEIVKTSPTISARDTLPRITGIGGIFFKSEDPEAAREWYAENLGLVTDPYGAVFEFRNSDKPDELNYLRWSVMADSSTYFDPSDKPFMINYRVQQIEALVDRLKASGVQVLDSIVTFEYGKFVHVLDPDGNAIELWEPVDSVLTQMGGATNH